MPYRLIKKEGAARRGEFQTVHGRFRHLLSKTLPLLPRSKAGFRHMI